MNSITVILLHVLIAQAPAQDSIDKLMEGLADKLVARVSDLSNGADMDKTTLAKAQSHHTSPSSAINLIQPVASRGFTSGVNVPRFRSPLPSVSAMQSTLKSYGIASSPMEELALTGLAATRDVSMKAQMNKVFSSMDSKTQAQVRALSDEVRVKAEAAEADAEAEAPAEPVVKLTDLAGSTAPFTFFDPAGFATDCPAGTLLFYREAELKHGRLGMLATLGLLVGEQFHPLFGGNIDVPGYRAFQETPLQNFWPIVLLAIGGLEISSILTFDQPFDKFSGYAIKKGWSIKTGRIPGDLGFDPIGLKPKDPKEFELIQNKELNNGRLAMLAAAGILAQELATGEKVFR